MKLKNHHIYLILISLSIISIILNYIFKYEFMNILANISYSIFAATLMAIFIDFYNQKREEEEKNRFKEILFKDINNQLSILIGNLLWFEEHMNEDWINWNLDIEYFLNIKFRIDMLQYNDEYEISFDEAMRRLEELSNKYKLEKMEKMDEEELCKIIKMFNILSIQCTQVVLRLSQLENNKILLDNGDYIKIEEFDQIFHDMNYCRILMSKKKKNYGLAINLLMSSTSKIRKISNYENNIKISITEGYFNIENIL